MEKYLVIISTVFIILVAASSASAVNEDAVNVNVVPIILQISPGEEYTVDITISSENQVVYGSQYDLIFDSAKVEAKSQVQRTFLNHDGANSLVTVNTLDNHAGKISYAETRMGTSEGVTGSGVLASVTFKAISNSEESINFVLQNVVLADNAAQEIKDVVVNGNVNPIENVPVNQDVPVQETLNPVYLKTDLQKSVDSTEESSSSSVEEVIAPDLLDIMNKSESDDKIAVIASVDPSSLFGIVQYLESKDGDVLHIKELKIANSVAFKGTSSVIGELSNLPYVNKISLDSQMSILENEKSNVASKEAVVAATKEEATEQTPGFGFVISVVMILILYMIKNEL